jgi:hypothetical protein
MSRSTSLPGLGALAALLLTLGACMPPQTPMQRLTDSAYDMNAALRFGRMDIALPYVSEDAQPQFARHHAGWGENLRIVDLDLVAIRAMGPGAVAVDLVVTWHPVDEMTIHQSRITQHWEQQRDDWRMVEEQRSGGDPGLFQGPAAAEPKQARLDAAAPPKTPSE